MKINCLRIAACIIGFSLSGLLPYAAAQGLKKVPAEQRIILVAGTDPWTETDIIIRPEDKVTFNASGKVCFSGSEKVSCMDPAGWGRQNYQGDWGDNWNECDDPMSDANHAALIGSIGSISGVPFYIGPQKTVTGKEGKLKLGINDCSFTGGLFYNSGSFSVVVSIVRGKKPE